MNTKNFFKKRYGYLKSTHFIFVVLDHIEYEQLLKIHFLEYDLIILYIIIKPTSNNFLLKETANRLVNAFLIDNPHVLSSKLFKF